MRQKGRKETRKAKYPRVCIYAASTILSEKVNMLFISVKPDNAFQMRRMWETDRSAAPPLSRRPREEARHPVARLAGLQETAIIRAGNASRRAFTTFGCIPALGGSTRTTSGLPICRNLADNVLQIAGKIGTVADIIDSAVLPRILYGLFDQLDPNNAFHAGSDI